MVKLKFIAALACLAMAACTPAEPPANNTATAPAAGAVSGPEACGLAAGTLADEKTLMAAETAYNVPAHAYVTLDAAGKLSAPVKASVRPKLLAAYEALKLARSAYAAGNVCDLNGFAASAKAFADSAKALMPSS